MMESIFLGALVVVALGAAVWAWRLSNGNVEEVENTSEETNSNNGK